MTRLVPDNINIILSLNGQEAKTRVVADNKEFYLLLKEKVVRDLDRMFNSKSLSEKGDALVDLYVNLDQFKAQLQDKLMMSWDDYYERRHNYTGDYENKIVLEDIVAGQNVDKMGREDIVAWGRTHEFPSMILCRDDSDVPYKLLGSGEQAWVNWIDAYENNVDNIGELVSAIRRNDIYEQT